MKRRGACTAHVLPSLSQPHPRGTWWSSFLYEKGSPRGNLARVLVVHLVEGGSSTMGEQTNCDLMRYVKLKKEANHVGPTLEARLYTLEYFWCVPSTRRTRRSLISTPSPPPTGAVARRMRWSLLRLTPAPSPMRAVSHRTRRKIYYSLHLLLIPTTLVIQIISYCLEYICPLVDFNMNY